MFSALGRFVYTRRWFVLLAGVILLVAGGVYGSTIFDRLKNGGFFDPNADSSKVTAALHEKLGRDEDALLILFTSRDGRKVEDPGMRAEVERVMQPVQGLTGTGTINTFYTTGSPAFVSNDRTTTYATIGFNGTETEQAETLARVRPLIKGESLQVQIGGAPAITEEIQEQVSKDLEHAELLTFPILAVLLLFIFGSVVAAALPLAMGGTAILGAFLILRFAADWTDIAIFAINIITMLGLGLAIDYGLFIVSRFREEMARTDGDVQASIVKTMQTAGRTVVFSGLTVAISLLSLLVFPQQFLKSIGMGGTAAVLVAMVAAVTLLPALLALLGKRINALSLAGLFRRITRRPSREAHVGADTQGFWYRLSMFVMRYPVQVLVLTLIPLLIAGLPFLRVKLTVSDSRSLPAGTESRIVSERLETEFPRNETVPVQMFVTFDRPATEHASLSALYDYTRRVAEVPGVRRVDSMVNLDPRLTKEMYPGFYSEQGLAANPQAQRALAGYSKDNYTLVSALYDFDVSSDEAQDLVQAIRKVDAPAGMDVMVGGWPAIMLDFLDSLGAGLPWALLLIIGVIFVLLFLMLGSVVVPLKAVVLNILSLSVSFGALVLIFQDGNLENLLGFTSLGSIEGSLPILMFAIAFGLSMDYEVFLLSRIKEHYDRTGDNTASVALGVQKTGTIITSAALLLVMVFASFSTGQLIMIKVVGVGLALAVLIDATIVRMLLVPAAMRLLGHWNWWAPAPLRALYLRAGLSESEVETEAEAAEEASAEGSEAKDEAPGRRVAAPEVGTHS